MSYGDESTKLIDLVGLCDDARDNAQPTEIITPTQRYIYNPKKGELLHVPYYLPAKNVDTRNVSTIESLVEIVLEECRKTNNTDGSLMTVIFDEKGATYYPDEKEFRSDDLHPVRSWRFQRRNSQQWEWLSEILDQPFSHKQFLEAIQGLKPSITEYKTLFNAVRRATVTNTSQLVSSPIIEEGQIGESLSWNMNIEGAGQAKIPVSFDVFMPFTRAGEKKYSFTVDIGIERVKKENHFTAAFILRCIEREVIIDRAITDEVAFFTEKTAGKPNILKVVNYS